PRDWSSDVCSSDLKVAVAVALQVFLTDDADACRCVGDLLFVTGSSDHGVGQTNAFLVGQSHAGGQQCQGADKGARAGQGGGGMRHQCSSPMDTGGSVWFTSMVMISLINRGNHTYASLKVNAENSLFWLRHDAAGIL